MRRYRVVKETGRWWVVSADFTPATVGDVGLGTYFTSYRLRGFAQADADARNRVEEMKDAKETLRA